MLLFIAAPSFAQRTENVHGVYTYTVGEDETFSIAEMRHKCIVGAQNEAIKEKFNENIKANTNMVDMDISGEAISRFVEEIEAYSAAEWLGDSKPSVFKADYAADRLTFTAEVWGRGTRDNAAVGGLKMEHTMRRHYGQLPKQEVQQQRPNIHQVQVARIRLSCHLRSRLFQ